MEYKAPRGTRDILPAEAVRWRYLEDSFGEICRLYGFEEIRTPIFEHTELFARSVGEESDIVSKEMYNFADRSGRRLTLRPEGTAPVVRAYLQRGLSSQPQPVKLFYYGPMFRYDRPQAGRYRQFHQLGAEIFGAPSPPADAEIITLGYYFLKNLEIKDTELQLNSVGCSCCRPAYREKLRLFLQPVEGSLCVDCRRRYLANPLRVLDCKQPGCREAVNGAPLMEEHLCPECRSHFLALLRLLDKTGIPYRRNPHLVRGLDYYTRTAFEYVPLLPEGGGSVGGGGRYDDLVEYCGGKPTPAVGVALGAERLLLAGEQTGAGETCRGFYIAHTGQEAEMEALFLAGELRSRGLTTEIELTGRSLKGQLKQAHRKGYSHVIIIGPRELEQGHVILKDMDSGSQQEYPVRGLPAKAVCLMEDGP